MKNKTNLNNISLSLDLSYLFIHLSIRRHLNKQSNLLTLTFPGPWNTNAIVGHDDDSQSER